MSKGAKQNWFQSPHVKNGFWFIHEDKNELPNFYKPNSNEKNIYITPSRNSKPIEISKNKNTPIFQSNQLSQNDNCKFQEGQQPQSVPNNKIQKPLINQKLDFQDSSIIKQEQDLMTPQRQIPQSDSSSNKQKSFLIETTAKKSSFNYYQEKKTRPKEKGLRMLSQKAYQIVLKMNGATYKQVANVLVNELATQDNVEIDGKDQQNIKRRVYDALNVLIALGVLCKNGRKIYGVQKKTNKIQLQKIQLEQLHQEYKLNQMRNIHKISKYRSILSRAQIIKALVKRNQQKTQKEKDIISFPFIAMLVPPQDQDKISVDNNIVDIKSNRSGIQTYGDLDIVEHLRFQIMPKIQ